MGGIKAVLLAGMTATTLMVMVGCAGVTQRTNHRAESHVKYHAAKQLNCDEASLKTICLGEYKSGECYQYQVVGCDASIVYQNSSGNGWTTGS